MPARLAVGLGLESGPGVSAVRPGPVARTLGPRSRLREEAAIRLLGKEVSHSALAVKPPAAHVRVILILLSGATVAGLGLRSGVEERNAALPPLPSCSRPTYSCAMQRRLFFFALCLSFSLLRAVAADDYKPGPDSQPQPGVPQGTVEKFTFKASKIYPGTERDYWVYVPKQYTPTRPAALMVFQDGGGYQTTNGSFRATVVMDNLIHRKEMPVTIGVFINPGSVPPAEPGQKARSNRSFEYDSLGDAYARFLLQELLPEVERNGR